MIWLGDLGEDYALTLHETGGADKALGAAARSAIAEQHADPGLDDFPPLAPGALQHLGRSRGLDALGSLLRRGVFRLRRWWNDVQHGAYVSVRSRFV